MRIRATAEGIRRRGGGQVALAGPWVPCTGGVQKIAYGGASYLVQAPLQRYVLHLSFAKFIASPEWRFFQVSALLSNGRGGETPYGGVGAPVNLVQLRTYNFMGG